jgi:uncharacterized membrane protein
MLQHSVVFDRPGYLALLALIPVLAWLGNRSLASLGRWRRWTTLALRSLVALGIILALADAQYRRESDELTVVYLLDQSLSIPAGDRQAMLKYVKASLEGDRSTVLDDRFAVVAFGRDASVEVPPVAAALGVPGRLESLPDPEYTDLASAIQRAKALFPPNAAKRIVLLTDGNENLGDAYREARAAADSGISMDVVPVYLEPRNEVSIEKVELPTNVRRGQPFDMRVVLRNDALESSNASVAGKLVVIRKSGPREDTVAEEEVTIPPGKQVLTIQQEIDQSDFYTYEARFVPADPAADGMAQNNVASAFTHIRGKGNVLLIESADEKGQFDFLADRLRSQEIEVEIAATDNLFNSLAELQRYDAVILANVSRSSVSDADSGASFSDEQIRMLVRNTRELGCGLIMIGGPDSYGAGGWANTELEEAMPVDFQIKNAEVVPVGALAIVIDRSGSMDGQKLAMSKAAAIAAVRTMGKRDYISVTAFDSFPVKTVPLRPVGDYRTVAGRIDKIASAGGTDMYPGMVEGFKDLQKAEAAVKHMIVLTDGQTPDAKFDELVRRMRQAKITVTTVAVGNDANVPLLTGIANRGAGKFYFVQNPRALPRIFLREVRRVARPLVYEPPQPVTPLVIDPNYEILRGLDGGVPPITGLVLTDVKENPLVDVLLRSPLPATPNNATLLATWTYGSGKAVALTTDAGTRWAKAWTEWEGYDKFFAQIVRWAMRPTGDTGNFTVAANTRDGMTELVVTALDGEENFANDQAITAAAIAPDMSTVPVKIEQVAPGRYVGEFPTQQAGSYLVVVNPGGGVAPIRTGVNVGYSSEYRDQETNLTLLKSLAGLSAGNGPSGVLVEEGLAAANAALPEAQNPFRRDLPRAAANQPIWPWLVVASACLFWGDVFIRRVQFDPTWLLVPLAALRDKILRRKPVVEAPETMSRLQSRKAQLNEQIDERRTATRFEWDEKAPAAPAAAPAVEAKAPPKAKAAKAPTLKPEADAPAESYTERLLKAKKQVWNEPPDDKRE